MGRGCRPGTCGLSKDEADEVTDDHKFVAKSLRLSIIDWWHVAGLYAPRVAVGVLVAVLALLWNPLLKHLADVFQPTAEIYATARVPWVMAALVVGVVAVIVLLPKTTPDVYLMDFSVFEAPKDWLCSHDDLIEACRCTGRFEEENLAFMRRILDRSKTGHATAWPPGITGMLRGDKHDTSMAAARAEAEAVIFPVVEDVLKRTGLKPKEIDVLIVNCSLFVPTPSLAAMVHSHFGLRPDCRTYNLGGMGCSAGLISVDLAKSLLRCHPGSRALLVSTENLTQQLYLGAERSMLVQNMLFRCGGAAVVLSSRVRDGFSARYKLLLTHRTQSSNDEALKCVWQQDDDEMNRGIHLSKDVPAIAGKALKHNLTSIGPYVLPIREQISVLSTESLRWCQRHLSALGAAWGISFLADLPRPKPYIPDFKTGLEHFCIHAGGRAVIDGVGENLRLRPDQCVPSKATLYSFGNTSSSSIWYELRFCEQETPRWKAEGAGKPIKPGERVIQVAFGSGFKCNSAVWLRMR